MCLELVRLDFRLGVDQRECAPAPLLDLQGGVEEDDSGAGDLIDCGEVELEVGGVFCDSLEEVVLATYSR